MVDLHVVVDWNQTKVYGPFDSKGSAEEWLAKQNIYVGQYDEQEVSILPLLDKSQQLETI